MANESQRPDVDKFFTDPKFQGDREFFRALHARYLEEGLKDAAAQPKPREGNIFDALAQVLGLTKKPDSDDSNIFDRWFGGSR